MKSEVEITVKVLDETKEHYKFDLGNTIPSWIAKSKIIKEYRERDQLVSITIPGWLAFWFGITS